MHVSSISEAWLIDYIAQATGVHHRQIEIDQPFARYGLSSTQAVEMISAVEQQLGRPLPPTLVWTYPTVQALTRYLAGEGEATVATHSSAPSSEPIAIIGIGCRFPHVNNAETFWRLLCDGVDLITEVPPDRWDRDTFYDANPNARGKMVSRYGAFIDQPDMFDAQFFGILPREAIHLDPRQRLALETAWEALEDAGIAPDSLAGSDTGVFMATLRDDYDRLLFEDPNQLDVYSSTGCAHSILANRLSYVFDLQGPSIALDTACSGSLVTAHLACQSLRSGESTLALAGGVNVILRPDATIVLSKTGIISPDGRNKTFDANANGIARGEGAGIVVLKLLSHALADGDSIYAVIRGSAINNDGRSAGLMAPRQEAQEALLRRAYRQAGIVPGSVQYIEAHGTGTRLGDPVEVNALNTVLSESRAPGQHCAIGSVKTNIGHTEAAAGVAGLIKLALALKHRQIPPSLHFNEPNPLIAFDTLPIRVQTRLGDWPNDSAPLIAGVSSFGIGGANAHLVLEEPPRPPAARRQSEADWRLFPLSARTPDALIDLARAYLAQLEQGAPPTLDDMCRTAGAGRNHFAHRRAWPIRSHQELTGRLQALVHEGPGPRANDRRRRLVFLFPDQEAYQPNLGRQLYEREPVFRAALEACDRALLGLGDNTCLAQFITADSATPTPELLQPALFAYQVALAALWRSWGIVPDVVLGHGLGEIAAAHVAGALSLADALRVVIHSSRAQQAIAQQQASAIVGLPLEKVQFVLMAYEDLLTISGSRSPTTSVVSGDPATLQRVLASLERQGISCRKLDGGAGATGTTEPIDLAHALAGIAPQPTTVSIYSSVTATPIDGAALDTAYWVNHAHAPGQFAAAVEQLARADLQTFVELSPTPTLAGAIHESFEHLGRACTVLPSAEKNNNERYTLLEALSALYERGWTVDWRALVAEGARVAPAPTYPWQRERYWFDQAPELA
jgi:myxalamid-type polyketide synthase MxaE and MxaD